MRVWLLQIADPLPLAPGVRRMRTGMLADKLVERGHEVAWWTSAFDHVNKRMLFERDTELYLRKGPRIRALCRLGRPTCAIERRWTLASEDRGRSLARETVRPSEF